MVFTCMVQSSQGVKKTPKYCMEVVSLIEMWELSGSCKVMADGAVPYLMLEVRVTRG